MIHVILRQPLVCSKIERVPRSVSSGLAPGKDIEVLGPDIGSQQRHPLAESAVERELQGVVGRPHSVIFQLKTAVARQAPSIRSGAANGAETPPLVKRCPLLRRG